MTFVRWALSFTILVGGTFEIGRAQTTTRVSVDSNGNQGDGYSGGSALSADGRFIAFASTSANLVPDDHNGQSDVFVHDRRTGRTMRVSVDSNGVEGNSSSGEYGLAISADGRYVAFESFATNFVLGDTNATDDIYVHDTWTGRTWRASEDSQGVGGNSASVTPSISADGRYVAFASDASNLVPGDTNGVYDVFVHDTQTGRTTRVSVDSNGAQGARHSMLASLSADGCFVAFTSYATDLVPDDTNACVDVFVHDRETRLTTRVSVNSDGVQGDKSSGDSGVGLSADGRYVAFQSSATNFAAGGADALSHMYVHDRLTARTTRVSIDSAGNPGNGPSGAAGSNNGSASISSDGRFVAFCSWASNLVPGDTNGVIDVFVHDRLTGTNARISEGTNGAQGDDHSVLSGAALSADGRYVAFDSWANTLVPGDTNGTPDSFLHDRGAASAFASLCAGDGTIAACPCANNGTAGHGCDNSGATGGASLTASGTAGLSGDTVELAASGELIGALSIVLQGDAPHTPIEFGGGLRCAGGNLRRLYAQNAIDGTIRVPQPGDEPVSSRSTALGDPISLGATRTYQVYYRDPDLAFCAPGFNATNAVAIAWGD